MLCEPSAVHCGAARTGALKCTASRNYACYDDVYSTTRCDMKAPRLTLLLLEVHFEHGLVSKTTVTDDVVHVQEEFGEL